MITVTLEEIERYRVELADHSAALKALDMIEDCEGDLEDAAIALALQVGQEPERSERWLDGLAKRWRVCVCQADIKTSVMAGSALDAVNALETKTDIPNVLALPVVLYVMKTGVEEFCKLLDEKRSQADS